ncbi:hypothetical protein Sjap_002217 [Stephania japonica]|uniref:Uncharacterized protein n=1 Tax=Stephania japonica TaxID=461633 RepID=A0AAP0KLF9_9MAGN
MFPSSSLITAPKPILPSLENIVVSTLHFAQPKEGGVYSTLPEEVVGVSCKFSSFFLESLHARSQSRVDWTT